MPGIVLTRCDDHFEGKRNGQGDFDDDDSSTRHSLGGKQRVLRRLDADRSDNTGFLKPAPHLEFLHLVVSFGARFLTVVLAIINRSKNSPDVLLHGRLRVPTASRNCSTAWSHAASDCR